jgi:hypothetical protein
MLTNFTGLLKIKGRVNNFLKMSVVTFSNQGILTDTTSKHLYSGETVPLKYRENIYLNMDFRPQYRPPNWHLARTPSN